MLSCIFNYNQDQSVWQEENMRLKNRKEDMMEKGCDGRVANTIEGKTLFV